MHRWTSAHSTSDVLAFYEALLRICALSASKLPAFLYLRIYIYAIYIVQLIVTYHAYTCMLWWIQSLYMGSKSTCMLFLPSITCILIAVFCVCVCVCVCVSVISEIPETGGHSATLLAPTWKASLGKLQRLLLELTRRIVREKKPLEVFCC